MKMKQAISEHKSAKQLPFLTYRPRCFLFVIHEKWKIVLTTKPCTPIRILDKNGNLIP
jgi:hypothetical protein